MTKRIIVPHDKHQPRHYNCSCRVSRTERAEVTEAAKRANLSVAALTRICTLHIIREGSLDVETTINVQTYKDEEEQA